MNKKLLVAILIVVLISAGIVGYFTTQNKKAATTTSTQNNQQAQTAPTAAIPDFVKAMQGAGSVKCTYTYSDVTTTSYIKDGKVRTEMTSKGVTNNSIMVNKVVYSWATGQKTGMMIDTTVLTASVTPGATGTPSYKDLDSLKNDLESYKPQCSNEVIADPMFEKPAGVTFTDYSKMMQDIKSKIPANVTIPQGYKVPAQ
jgi:hypothetical protein